MAWLDGWRFRKQVSLSRAAGAVTDYQMVVFIGESSGSVGADVDCKGKCLPSFADIRFTSADGETLLNYWIESVSGSTPNQLATVWVKFDSIGVGATVFYMYYGNDSAASASSGVGTFVQFDDFERGSDGSSVGGGWTQEVAQCVISTAQKADGTRSCRFVAAAGSSPAAYRSLTFSANNAIGFRCYKISGAPAGRIRIQHGNGSYMTDLFFYPGGNVQSYATAYTDTGVPVPEDQWFSAGMSDFNLSARTFDIWLNHVKIGENHALRSASSSSNRWRFQAESPGGAGYDAYIDSWFVRKFVSVEPAWGVWGAEEGDAVTYIVDLDRGPLVVGGQSVPLLMNYAIFMAPGRVALSGDGVSLLRHRMLPAESGNMKVVMGEIGFLISGISGLTFEFRKRKSVFTQ